VVHLRMTESIPFLLAKQKAEAFAESKVVAEPG
jgi:hypothetical protein